jgi:hypothetical protein
MAKRQFTPTAHSVKPATGQRGSIAIRPFTPVKPPAVNLGPAQDRHPAARTELPSPGISGPRGSTSIKPEAPPLQTGSVSLFPARLTGRLPQLTDTVAPAPKQPLTGPTAFEVPGALQRPRNGANSPDGFKISRNRGPDGGGRVDDPFSPAWDK